MTPSYPSQCLPMPKPGRTMSFEYCWWRKNKVGRRESRALGLRNLPASTPRFCQTSHRSSVHIIINGLPSCSCLFSQTFQHIPATTAMDEGTLLLGACSCGRNHYLISIPTNPSESLRVLYDDRAEHSKPVVPVTKHLVVKVLTFHCSTHALATCSACTHKEYHSSLLPRRDSQLNSPCLYTHPCSTNEATFLWLLWDSAELLE